MVSQSRQSAKPFLQSSELGLSQPPTRRLVCPLPPVSGGRGTLAGEKGVGRVPIPTRGVQCGTLYMYVLCAARSIGHVVFVRVLSIRDVYPGSKNSNKREGGKFFLLLIPLYEATNFTKLKIILVLKCSRKKFGPIFKEL